MILTNNTKSVLKITLVGNDILLKPGESSVERPMTKELFDVLLSLISEYESEIKVKLSEDDKKKFRWHIHVIPEQNLIK